jgi:hypothetical protein
MSNSFVDIAQEYRHAYQEFKPAENVIYEEVRTLMLHVQDFYDQHPELDDLDEPPLGWMQYVNPEDFKITEVSEDCVTLIHNRGWGVHETYKLAYETIEHLDEQLGAFYAQAAAKAVTAPR